MTGPLAGRRVVVTRPRRQAAALVEPLERAGAEVVEAPLIEIVPPHTWAPVDAAIAALDTYDWLVFTSANGVEKFLDRVAQAGRAAGRPAHGRVAAIGPATAAALAARGVTADLVAARAVAEGLVEAFGPDGFAGRRFLLPRAEEAREVLPDEVRARGGSIDVVTVYRTQPAAGVRDLVTDGLRRRAFDAVTFTSASTVHALLALLPGEPAARDAMLAGVALAAIGPITAAALREAGLEPAVVAGEHTAAALAGALAAHFARGPAPGT